MSLISINQVVVSKSGGDNWEVEISNWVLGETSRSPTVPPPMPSLYVAPGTLSLRQGAVLVAGSPIKHIERIAHSEVSANEATKLSLT
jgi:hypothetical protein